MRPSQIIVLVSLVPTCQARDSAYQVRNWRALLTSSKRLLLLINCSFLLFYVFVCDGCAGEGENQEPEVISSYTFYNSNFKGACCISELFLFKCKMESENLETLILGVQRVQLLYQHHLCSWIQLYQSEFFLIQKYLNVLVLLNFLLLPADVFII